MCNCDKEIKTFIEARLEKIGSELLITNSNYIKTGSRIKEVINKIKEISNNEKIEKLIDELDELVSKQNGISEEIIYKQAFKDCRRCQMY